MPNATGPLCVVSHTHWDREWYRTAEAFRVGLVTLVDDVLGTDGPFLLDGQAIVLEDYAAWKRSGLPALRRRLRSGEVEAGPWYVLADNLIPSGEALVRNLLAGRRALGEVGATAPRVLYCPDSFGHPAAGPMLATGFGLELAIVWRGYGGRGWPDGDAARWRAPSGDEVQLHHLPPSGYEHGSELPVGAEEARLRWGVMHEALATRADGRPMLVLNGADHHARQPDFDEAIEAGRRLFGDALRVTTLASFAHQRVASVAARRLPVVRGELRASPSYVWALQGTFGTRAYQKRENATLERLLTRELEPWAALAWWYRNVDLQAAVHGTWRLALSSHPHDTLCGCSIDDVARSMDDRMARASAGAHAARRDALHGVVGLDSDATRPDFASTGRSVLIANPVPRRRSGVVDVEVDVPLANLAVGFGSAGRSKEPREVPPFSVGNLPMQRLGGARGFARHDAPHHYPRMALVHRERVLVWAEQLAPFGAHVLSLGEHRLRKRPRQPVVAGSHQLDNGVIRVWWDATHGLCCGRGGEEWLGILAFETVGDGGDLYTPSPIDGTLRRADPQAARVTMRGPLRGELLASAKVPVAERSVVAATGEATDRKAGEHRVQVRVQLDAGAPWFRLVLSGMNTCEDQRLRVVLRSGCRAHSHVADAALGAVRRPSAAPEFQEGDVELIPGTAPMHRYVSVFDAGRGCTLISDGLAEYEATRDGDIAVTLVRSVGELSRADLPERPGHAGWPASTPAAQCLGPWEASLAFLPHGGATDETRAEIEDACDDVLVPPTGSTIVSFPDAEFTGPALEGSNLSFLACKRSEDGVDLVVRCVNRSDAWTTGAWCLPGVTHAWLARLDESPRGALPVHDGVVRFAVAPHATSTIRLRRQARTE